jgi:hypothetical protein
MFGEHGIPVNLDSEKFSLTLAESDGAFLYKRDSADGTAEKVLPEAPERILISPVEPLNRPSKITPYLMIGFSTPVVFRPHSSTSLFLKFPVEIGVFLPRGKDYDLLDTISLSWKKFSLYGNPRGGNVCRFWKSDVYKKPPETIPVLEGVLKLAVSNETEEWVPVRRTVLDVHGMKIYYQDSLVSAKAQMTILSGERAETDFSDSPLQEGMKRSIEIFRMSKLAVTSSRFHMGEGL